MWWYKDKKSLYKISKKTSQIVCLKFIVGKCKLVHCGDEKRKEYNLLAKAQVEVHEKNDPEINVRKDLKSVWKKL